MKYETAEMSTLPIAQPLLQPRAQKPPQLELVDAEVRLHLVGDALRDNM